MAFTNSRAGRLVGLPVNGFCGVPFCIIERTMPRAPSCIPVVCMLWYPAVIFSALFAICCVSLSCAALSYSEASLAPSHVAVEHAPDASSSWSDPRPDPPLPRCAVDIFVHPPQVRAGRYSPNSGTWTCTACPPTARWPGRASASCYRKPFPRRSSTRWPWNAAQRLSVPVSMGGGQGRWCGGELRETPPSRLREEAKQSPFRVGSHAVPPAWTLPRGRRW